MGECPLVKKIFGELYHSQHKDMQYLCTCDYNEDKADFVGMGALISAALVVARAAGGCVGRSTGGPGARHGRRGSSYRYFGGTHMRRA